MIEQLKKLFLCSTVLGASLCSQALAQSPKAAIPDKPTYFYFSPSGTLYVNPLYTYQLLLQPTSSDKLSESIPVGRNSELASLQLEEGVHTLSLSTEKGGTRKLTFTVDASSPLTTLDFGTSIRYETASKLKFFGKNTVLEVKSTDRLSGVWKTFFSINGAEFQTYAESLKNFKKDEQIRLRYYATDLVGNQENTKEDVFFIDVTPPAVSLSLEGTRNQNVFSDKTLLHLSATDQGAGVKQMYYRIGKGAFESYLAPLNFEVITDGAYTLQYFAVDQVNNYSDTLSYAFLVDKKPPVVSYKIEGPLYTTDNFYYIRNDSRVILTATDEKASVQVIRYQIEDQPEAAYSQPVYIRGESGTYLMVYWASDILNNVSNRENIRLFLDLNAPSTAFQIPGGYLKEGEVIVLNKGTSLSLQAEDLESGIKQTQYRFNREAWKAYTEPLKLDKPGTFSLSFYSEDRIGNVEKEQSIQIKVVDVDQAKLAASMAKPTEAPPKIVADMDLLVFPAKQKHHVWLSASDDPNAPRFLLLDADGKTPRNLNKDASSDMTQKIGLTWVGKKTPFQYDTDAELPKSVLTTAGAKNAESDGIIYFSGGLNISFTATDALSGIASIMVAEDQFPFEAYRAPLKNFMNERAYTVRYYAVDKVGNTEAARTYQFQVDLTPPKTKHKVLSNFKGTVFSPQTEIELETSDNMSGVETTFFRINEGEFQAYKRPFRLQEFTTIRETNNRLEYYSVDKVGNRENVHYLLFRYDNDQPDIVLNFLGNHFVRGSQTFVQPGTRMELRNQDLRKELRAIRYSMDGNAPSTVYESSISMGNQKRFTFRYQAEDVLGNKTAVVNKEILVDNEAPKSSTKEAGLFMYNDKNELIFGKGGSMALTASDDLSGVKTLFYKIGNGEFRPYSKPVEATHSGRDKLTFYAIDQVGNKEQEQVLAFIADYNGPEVIITIDGTALGSNVNEISLKSTSIISVTARDEHSEVQGVEYKLGDKAYQIYLRALTNFPSGKTVMEVKSADILGNMTTRKVTLSVE